MEDLVSTNKILLIEINQSNCKKIGEGGFGKVYSGKIKSLQIAMKKIKNISEEDFLKEINIIRLFRHPHIPYFYALDFKKDKLSQVGLISELIKGDTFDVLVKKRKPIELQIVIHLLELSYVLLYFHSFNLIHRDLKPSNIMVDFDSLKCKLLDFGISKITNKSCTTTITLGTILYMAPDNFQVYREGQSNFNMSKSKINSKVDVWAIGCIISEVFSGKKPWSEISDNEQQILGHLFNLTEFPLSKNIKNERIIELIKNCTKSDPIQRFTIGKVINSLLVIVFYCLKDLMDVSSFLNDFGMLNDKPKLKLLFLIKVENYLKILQKKIQNLVKKKKETIIINYNTKKPEQMKGKIVSHKNFIIPKASENTSGKFSSQRDLTETNPSTVSFTNKPQKIELDLKDKENISEKKIVKEGNNSKRRIIGSKNSKNLELIKKTKNNGAKINEKNLFIKNELKKEIINVTEKPLQSKKKEPKIEQTEIFHEEEILEIERTENPEEEVTYKVPKNGKMRNKKIMQTKK